MKILRQKIEIAHHGFLHVALGKKNGSMIFQKILLWIVWRSLQLDLESRHIETNEIVTSSCNSNLGTHCKDELEDSGSADQYIRKL